MVDDGSPPRPRTVDAMTANIKLGYSIGYWSAGPPPGALEAIQEAERLGFDSVWTAEAYGSDALTPLAWWGAQTERIRLGTGIVQLSARTPAATAMAAITLDHLSGGRFILGLGASGPQVVEGWYGAAVPAARSPAPASTSTSSARSSPAARRSSTTASSTTCRCRAASGLGKALKSTVHPLRTRDPDPHRRRGTEERRPGGRDRRRLAAAVLRPEGGRASTASAWPARLRRQRRGRQGRALRGHVAASRSCPATTSSAAPTPSARSSPSTPAGWAPAAPTSTSRSSPAWATRTSPPRSRSCTSPGARTRRRRRSRSPMVEDVALVGPPEKIREELTAWQDTCITTFLVSGSGKSLPAYAELLLG